MIARPRLASLALLLVLAGLASSCSYLRDEEPWTATVEYRQDAAGNLIVTPLVIQADASYGLVQVVNETEVRRGFSVFDLAVFEEIPPGLTINVEVDEARDGQTYTWTDHLNPGAFDGQLVVVYLEEEFRGR